jgi:hypothetical protein
VTITSNASSTPTLLSAATTFYNLTINAPTATVINQGAFAPTINNDLTITAGVFNSGGAAITGNASGTFSIASGATFCLGGTTASTSATCDSGATDTTVRSMPTFATYTFNSSSNFYYLYDATPATLTAIPTPGYGNLVFRPKLTAAATWTLGNGFLVQGTFTSTPTATGGSNRVLTINLGSGTNTISGAVTLTGRSTTNVGSTKLDVLTNTITIPSVDIQTVTVASELTISTGTLNLSGTSGTLFTNNGTFTSSSASTVDITSTGTVNFNTGSSSTSFYNLTFSGSGTKTVGANFTATNQLTLSGGTLSGSSYTITLSGTGTVFNYSSGDFTAGTSTIKMTDTSASSVTFAGGGKTYGNIWFARGTSAGDNIITGSNTFSDFKDDGTAAHSIKFTAGTTTNIASFNVNGTLAGGNTTITSVTGAFHTLNYIGTGVAAGTYLTISYSHATPATYSWYAGATPPSSDGGNNTGWIFGPAPCRSITTGNWSDGTKWAGCTGSGGKPGTGDITLISAGTIMTMNEASAVLGTITVNGTLAEVNYALSGTTLTIGATGTLTSTSGTITLSGANPSDTLMTLIAGGSFRPGSSSTVALTGNASNTINSSGFTGDNKLNSLQINITGVTKTLGADLELAIGGTLTITLGTFDTNSTGNYSLTTGKIFIANSVSAIFNANISTITLNAVSGNLFTKGSNGVFNAGTSTVVFNPDATSILLVVTSNPTFYNLTLSPTLSADRTWTLNSGVNLTINGDFLISPSGSANRLTVNMGQTITIGATKTLTIQPSGSATATLDTNSNFAVSTGFIDIESGGTIVANGTTFTLTGTTGTLLTLASGGTFTCGTSTMYIIGNGSNIINSAGFTGSNKLYNLTTHIAGVTKTLGADIELDPAGTLRIDWATFDTNSTYNYSITAGNIYIYNSVDAIFNANNSTINLNATSGSLLTRATSGVFNAGGSTVAITSASGSPTLLGNSAVTFYNLTINAENATVINQGALVPTIGKNLNITRGVFNSGGANLTGPGAGSGTFTIGAGATFCLGGTTASTTATCDSGATDTTARSMPLFNTYTFNSASTVRYLSNAAQTVSITPTYGNLYFTPVITAPVVYTISTGTMNIAGNFESNPSASGNYNLRTNQAGIWNVTGTFTVKGSGSNPAFTTFSTTGTNYALNAERIIIGGNSSASALSANGSNVTLNGISGTLFTLNSGATFTAGTSTVILSGNGNATPSSGSPTFYSLTSSGTGTKTLGEALAFSSSGVLTISDGTFDTKVSSNYAITGGKISIANLATAILNANDSDITLNATSGTLFTKGTDGVFNAGTSKVDLSGAGTATINSGTFNTTNSFYDLTSSGTGTKTLGGDITVGNVLTISAGEFSLGTSTLTLSGTTGTPISNSATFTTPAGSTTTYTGNNSGGDTNIYATNYNNLTLNNGLETYVLTGTTQALGNLTITAGTLDVTATDYGLTVGGNWTNTGTFNAQNGLVIFNSGTTALVTGDTNFYDLTITHTSAKEVNFSRTPADIIGVTNLFTVAGNVGQLIKLYSDLATNKWHFNPTGTASVSYADVMDGGCEGTAITITPTNSNNGGNNEFCWSFVKTLTFSISNNDIDFGKLTATANRYATTGAGSGGSAIEGIAHTLEATTNAGSGYVITVQGATLNDGLKTIDAIGGTAANPTFGIEQFGLRITASGGTGAVSSPYNDVSKYAYDATSSTSDEIASEGTGDDVLTTYSVRYLGNISGVTQSGDYSTTLTYIISGSF